MSLGVGGTTELHDIPHWITYALLPQPDGKKPKKVPYTPGTEREARVNDSRTWRSFDAALDDRERTGRWPAVVITPEMNLTLIDIDGQQNHSLVDELDSYTERSVSGNGIHILVRGRPPAGFVAPPGVEIYPRHGSRGVILTGDLVDGRGTIEDRTAELATLFPARSAPPVITPVATEITVEDETALVLARRMAGFAPLFDRADLSAYDDDHSRADLGLLNYLIVAGVTEPEQLDRIFRDSALMRPKWERSDYRARTLSRALDGRAQPFDGWAASPTRHRSHSVPPAAPGPDRRAELARTVATQAAEIDRLRAELDRCCDDRADLRRDLAQAKRDVSAIIGTLANPNLGGDAAGKALVLAAAEVQHRSHTVPPDPEGYVQVNATRVADAVAYVPDGAGGTTAVPIPARVSPRTVSKYIALAADRGLIPAKKAPVPAPADKPGISPEGWFWKAAPTLADQLAPLAVGSVYTEDNPRPLRGGDPKQRRRLRLPGCPECGGHHVACASCGVLYETPAAIDIETGALIMADAAAEPRSHSVPPAPADAELHPTVGTVLMSTSLPPEPRSHSVPPDREARREAARADLRRRADRAPWGDPPPAPPPTPHMFPGFEPPPIDHLTDVAYGGRR